MKLSPQIISKYSVISLSDKYVGVKIWGTTLKIVWELTIHKYLAMKLPKDTVDIGTMEYQDLTLTALSRVPSPNDLHISLTFSFD